MRKRELLTRKAQSVKVNVVACAHALHVGERFESDSDAKRAFGVPRTTNVRSWVVRLNELDAAIRIGRKQSQRERGRVRESRVTVPGRKRGRPPNSSYTAEELQQRRDARERNERDAEQRRREEERARDDLRARELGFETVDAYGLHLRKCEKCRWANNEASGLLLLGLSHHAAQREAVRACAASLPLAERTGRQPPRWFCKCNCSSFQQHELRRHRRAVAPPAPAPAPTNLLDHGARPLRNSETEGQCAWCELAPPVVGVLTQDRTDGAWYCQSCWEVWRDLGV